jgi:hypothetical protein
MDAREESIRLLAQVQGSEVQISLEDLGLMSMANKRHLDAIDEDLQKLRKELRTRNGGDDA